MRCASAFAALTVIVLGTPAIAMASTLSSGSGPGASTLTEVSGPVLAPPEGFRYHGQTCTPRTVR